MAEILQKQFNMKQCVFYISVIFFLVISAAVFFYYIFQSNYKNILYSKVDNIDKVELNESAIKDIKTNIDTIVAYSTKYDISPLSIMGIIAAERSLHAGPVNFFEEYYVRKTFLDKSDAYLYALVQATKKNTEKRKLNGESEQEFGFRLRNGLIWTIGLCQISIMKSLEIDSLIAQNENRNPRTVKENIKALLIPTTNIQYCAFEIKRIQDEYFLNTKIDISNNIGVLCTLYNTGRLKESILRVQRTKGIPISNDFGRFIETKIDTLQNILKLHTTGGL